jgi:CO/xanthine dehydrogenase Mo-binding subunit
VHPHTLRHACGYKLANDGHDTRAIQHYLGHRNIQHTVKYTELALARAQAVAAQVTGLPLEKVRVHNHLLGGGFGRRLDVDFIAQAVEIATHVEDPVKVVWTREEDIQHD